MDRSSLKSIWLVTEGDEPITPLGAFSTPERASRYHAELIRRFLSGQRLKFQDRPLAPNPGQWELGIAGPSILELSVDRELDYLPGGWSVRVDEGGRMIGGEFRLSQRASGPADVKQYGPLRLVCEGYGRTPQEAFHAARAGMRDFLSSPRSHSRH